ncbi:hypothetical protein [Hominifimenecus sp. rT4P-3]|uniref:hypothetical protein n=1 Tax=Hominifimenecus sp. rT4P-3 TaxID=3242979 RepID=UPI003DA1E0F6
MDGNYVKFYRGIKDWEWYRNLNTFKLFFHCIVQANWQEGKFEGETVGRGSFVSSYSRLAEETGLTYDEVRTAVKNLTKTKNLTVKRYPKYSVFTVVSYDDYQTIPSQAPDKAQLGPSQDPIDSQLIPSNKRKKEKQEGKKGRNIYSMDGALNDAICDFIEFRRQIKAPMTEKAVSLMVEKLNRLTPSHEEQIEILHQSILNDWKGVFPLKSLTEKLENSLLQDKPLNQFHNFDQRDTDYDALLAVEERKLSGRV